MVVEVNDSGVGIEPEALPTIFNAFEQGERSITRQFGGLGLGLAISKALVEMHGGTIEAHSEGKGKGATFRCDCRLVGLRRLGSSGPGEHYPHGRFAQQDSRPLRLLLVEDHGDTAEMMKRMLRTRRA